MRLLPIAVAALFLFVSCAPEDEGPVEVPAETTAPPLLPVSVDGQWGYIDREGELMVEPRFEMAWPFSENMALVQIDGRYGFIDIDGDLRIDAEFDDAWYFSGGLAPVKKDDQWKYVDVTGETIVETEFRLSPSALEKQHEERPQAFGLVRSEGTYGFRNEDGDVVIEPQFDRAWHFRDGRARVRLDGQWGYIDTSGSWLVEPRFDHAWDFRGGIALVQVDDRYGYIDRDGTYIWEPTR